MVWKHYIIRQLVSKGVNGHLLSFIKNFLADRCFRVRNKGELSQLKIQENGVPQGSVISVTLFLLAINEVTTHISQPIKVSLFADDLVIYLKGNDVTTIQSSLQKTINEIENWLFITGFQINTDKTKCIVFAKKKTTKPTLQLLGNSIETVEKIRYLGMNIDDRLTWEYHIKELITKSQNGLYLLKVLSNHHWGSDNKLLLLLYRALVRSRIDYGSVAYDSASKRLLKLLDSIHNSALRTVLGAHRTSPIPSIYCEVGEPTLQLRRQYLSLSFAATIASHKQHPTEKYVFSNRYKTLFSSRNKIAIPFYERLNNLPITHKINFSKICQTHLSISPPWLISKPNLDLSLQSFQKTNTPANIISQTFQILLSRFPDHNKFYTDASKTKDKVGAAFVHRNESQKFFLPKNSSIFSGETLAILQTVKHISTLETEKSLIITDSLSAIKGIQQIYSKNPTILDIKEILHQLTISNKEVVIVWVPSHVGISGNENADRVAREAVNEWVKPVEHRLWIGDVKSFIKVQMKEQWQNEWQRKLSKLKEIKNSVEPWRNLPAKRSHQVIISRLRIGHTRYTHDHIFKKEPKKMCVNCTVPVSVRHILVECPAYDDIRRKYKLEPNLKTLLENRSDISDLIAFLTETHLIDKI
ncbi:uncharacterized protein [Leptinotarsa decemlineata]|uniref:uncharacterized protein n=1 Tax=Leptinotarsa decemlineata TaxID=7539 RepID=UPI003D305D86